MMPHIDHYDADTDDDTDIRPPSKKRTKVTALLKSRTQAPKFKYPPGWPNCWEKRMTSDLGEAVGSPGKCGLQILSSNGNFNK